MSGRWRMLKTVFRLTLRQPATRAFARWTGFVAVALIGVTLGLMLGGSARGPLGPFQAEFSVMPSLAGETRVVVPPLGSLTLDTHAGPERLTVRLENLDQARTQQLISDADGGIAEASKSAYSDVRSGITQAILKAAGAALLGALILSALIYRRIRQVAIVGGLAITVIAGSLGVSLLTLRKDAIEEPRYEGLLVNAPAVVGDAREIATSYERYRKQLQQLVTNIGKLYTTVSNLPVFGSGDGAIRVLHISDMHLNPGSWDVVRTVVTQFNIQVVVDTGDLVDWGTDQESETYAKFIGDLKVPYIFVKGNHDSPQTVAAVAQQPNAIVLENRVAEVAGLKFAGIGDPRFTPDKNGDSGELVDRRRLFDTSASLAETIKSAGGADVALVHDPKIASALPGEVPLVLAGHTHKREVTDLGQGTLLMVEGSTGGAGLRGLEKSEPTPLSLSVLYFTDGVVEAYDDISVGGTGRSEVTLQRRLLKPAVSATPSPTTTVRPSATSLVPVPTP